MLMVRTMDGVIHCFKRAGKYKHVGDQTHSILRVSKSNGDTIMQFNFDHIVNYGFVNETRQHIAGWDDAKVIEY